MSTLGRGERLFRITAALGDRRTVLARDLAAQFGVSERTIYRDMTLLARQGVPVTGAAGVGYVSRGQHLTAPMALSDDEAEALVLGLRIVATWADPGLAAASSALFAKLPLRLAPDTLARLRRTALVAPFSSEHVPAPSVLPVLRRAVRQRRKVAFDYIDAEGRVTTRTARPLSIAFFSTSWLLAAWCELRGDFRSFRLDRVRALTARDERFANEPGRRLEDYFTPPESSRTATDRSGPPAPETAARDRPAGSSRNTPRPRHRDTAW
jgi:predicted DNA-binding transcriptional regulator YafY